MFRRRGDVADNKTGKPGLFPALAKSNAAGEQKGILPAAHRTSISEALTGQCRPRKAACRPGRALGRISYRQVCDMIAINR